MNKTISERIMNNKKIILKYSQKFYNIFQLSLTNYFDQHNHLICGFDIVKFDEAICTPDGVSCKDFVLNKYAEKGVEILTALLDS